jgi:O-methyltransferase
VSRFLPRAYLRLLDAGPRLDRRRTTRLFQDARLAQWRRQQYWPFVWSERERIFLAIARHWLLNSAPAQADKHTRSDATGYYFEFGSYGARTMRMAHDVFRHAFDWTYVSFDSFEGLPNVPAEETQGLWTDGLLAMTEEEFVRRCLRHGVPRERLRTVKGFYDESLTPQLRDELLPGRCRVALIDCDLYRSTVPVLEFLVPFLDVGSVIIFDDWFLFHGDPDQGERLAFAEFQRRHPDLHFEPLVGSAEAQAFVLAAVRPRPAEGSAPAPARADTDRELAGLDMSATVGDR